ncbi:MAG TPA: hypothetical protein VGH76_02195 [Actinomycetospora sp.]|jgi:hypothetical protein|uniref:hypothetical protein n=1 Tax=Actinomycetospora sp. TaxID=1872135 RepID=UPI002F426D89
MRARVGQLLASTADATTVVVIRWPDDDLDLTCGGAAMVDAKERAGAPAGAAAPTQGDGTQLGKRYVAEHLAVELLCSKAGAGTLAIDGTPLVLKSAKPLPASD